MNENELFKNYKQWASTAMNVLANGQEIFYGKLSPYKRRTSSIKAYSVLPTPFISRYTIKIRLMDLYSNNSDSDILDDKNFVNYVKSAIITVYSNYYNADQAETKANSVLADVINVIRNSIAIYTSICDAWFHQSVREIKDKVSGYQAKTLFSREVSSSTNLPFYNEITSNSVNAGVCRFDWSISNVSWNHDVLSKLDCVRLPKNTAKMWKSLISNAHLLSLDKTRMVPTFVKFEIEYPTLDDILGGWATSGNTFDAYKTKLSNYESEILNKVGSIPYLDDILHILGCEVIDKKDFTFTNQELFDDDFTRPLSARVLHYTYDEDNIIWDLMENLARGDYQSEIQSDESNRPLLGYFNAANVDYREQPQYISSLVDSLNFPIQLEGKVNLVQFDQILRGNVSQPQFVVRFKYLAQGTGNSVTATVAEMFADGNDNIYTFKTASAVTTTQPIQDVENRLGEQMMKRFMNLPMKMMDCAISYNATSISSIDTFSLYAFNPYDAIGRTDLLKLVRGKATVKWTFGITDGDFSQIEDKNKDINNNNKSRNNNDKSNSSATRGSRNKKRRKNASNRKENKDENKGKKAK